MWCLFSHSPLNETLIFFLSRQKQPHCIHPFMFAIEKTLSVAFPSESPSLSFKPASYKIPPFASVSYPCPGIKSYLRGIFPYYHKGACVMPKPNGLSNGPSNELKHQPYPKQCAVLQTGIFDLIKNQAFMVRRDLFRLASIALFTSVIR
jgi:hypothetical protein